MVLIFPKKSLLNREYSLKGVHSLPLFSNYSPRLEHRLLSNRSQPVQKPEHSVPMERDLRVFMERTVHIAAHVDRRVGAGKHQRPFDKFVSHCSRMIRWCCIGRD